MSNSTFNLRSLMDQHKLVGPNFLAWRRNLRIVLQSEMLEHTLSQLPPAAPGENASEAERAAYNIAVQPFGQAYCVMLGSMSDDLRKQ